MKHIKWSLPLLFFIAIAPFTPKIDLFISRLFFNNDHFSSSKIWHFFYQYGTWPAWILAFVALFTLIFSFFFQPLKNFRREALFYLLSLSFGGGLVINGLFKQFWSRPRPVQLVEFNGFTNYSPFWLPSFEKLFEPMRSFPCGHCCMGFIFITLCMMARQRNNRAILTFSLLLTLFFTLGLSLSRIATGGHFVSDVLASFLIMWLSILLSHFLIYQDHAAYQKTT